MYSSGKPAAPEEHSVMKLFIQSGKDTNPETLTARLLLLTATAVRPFGLRLVRSVTDTCLSQLHTSSMTITHAIYDLCAMPEYIEQLRAEARTALAEDNGEWQFTTIKRLRRLDSFLKESQRVNQATFRKKSASLKGIQSLIYHSFSRLRSQGHVSHRAV